MERYELYYNTGKLGGDCNGILFKVVPTDGTFVIVRKWRTSSLVNRWRKEELGVCHIEAEAREFIGVDAALKIVHMGERKGTTST